MINNIDPKMMKRTSGFTLMEIIIVIALIGAIGAIILPNLRTSVDSQIMLSIRALSSQMRLTYDDAIFSGRRHRMIFNLRTSEFWTEKAPLDYTGRAPLAEDEKSESLITIDEQKTFRESMIEEGKNTESLLKENGVQDGIKFYFDIPVANKIKLMPVNWLEVSDSVIYKQKLKGSVVFIKILSGLSRKPLEHVSLGSSKESSPSDFAYVYFLPSGQTTPLSLQLGYVSEEGLIEENAPKYTINLNTLTGQSKLLDGFQDANFELPK